MKRVTGIGGIIFKAQDAPALLAWYQRHLGIDVFPGAGCAAFGDVNASAPDKIVGWAIAPANSDQLAPGKASFMVDYRVEDLHGLVKSLKEAGCEVCDEINESEFGSFAWVIDPEGNKVGLSQLPPPRNRAAESTEASDRHARARDAARKGDYAFALSEYIWYHEHALETEPSLYGVRLSYALNDWMKLGASYPPAIQALEEILARKTTTLREGGGDHSLFHDVARIAERLGRERDTYELFRVLDQQRPKFAEGCAKIAFPAIIACEDFALARRYLGDASARARVASEMFLFSQRRAPVGPPELVDATRKADVKNYVTEVRMMIQVLEATGERTEASRVRELALSAIADSPLRGDVERALSGASTA